MNPIQLTTKTLLTKPTTILGRLLEPKDQQQTRRELADVAKTKALELRQIQIAESVQTSKLQSEIIVQTAFDRALVEHHSELQEIRSQNNEQRAVSLIGIFESKAASEQRLRALGGPLAQRAIEASDAMHVATAQRTVNRSDE